MTLNWEWVELFHFLRPWWLLLIPAAVTLGWIVRKQQNVRDRWQGVIAPHLLNSLIVGERTRWRIRPVHLTCALLALAGLGLSGPSWERELPPFSEDTAPLLIVLCLSETMDAIDVQPTRLERAKQKIRDLLERRSGSRTALMVYAGSAHLVLPLTNDPDLLTLFLSSLSTELAPVKGRDASPALQEAEALLQREEVPGTLLFVTDGVEPADYVAFEGFSRRADDQLMVLAVGTAAGGPIRTGDNRFKTDASGRRVTSRMNIEEFQRLRKTGIPVTTLTLDGEDVEWIQGRVERHLRIAQEETAEARWKDMGYYLVIPVALLAALWFRRGWTVRWGI